MLRGASPGRGRPARPHPFSHLGRAPGPGERTLRNRAHCLTPLQTTAVWATILVLPIALFVGLSGMVGAAEDPESVVHDREALALLARLVEEDGVRFGIAVFSLIAAVVSMIGGARERVFLSPEGLRYRSGLPRWLGALHASFDLAREDILDVRASGNPVGGAPALMRIEFASPDGTRRLFVFNYIDPEVPRPGAFRVLSALRPDPDAISALFDEFPLVVWARSLGFDVAFPKRGQPVTWTGTSLGEKPRLTMAVILGVAFLGYGALDLGLITETYAAGLPLAWIAGGATMAAVVGWAFVDAREVTGTARMGIAGFLAVATAVALLPGLIRINRLDDPAFETHAYRYIEGVGVEAVDPASPVVHLPDAAELWRCKGLDRVHDLEVRKGWLGFWQLEIDSVYRGHSHAEAPGDATQAEPHAGSSSLVAYSCACAFAARDSTLSWDASQSRGRGAATL